MIAEIRSMLFSHHVNMCQRIDAKIDAKFAELKQEIKAMSATFETDLAAQTAATQALATEVSNGLAANATAIQALKDQIANGGTVSEADLSTLQANTKAIQDATTAMQAALNPVTPPPATP